MEVKFDNGKRRISNPETRVYSPTGDGTTRVSFEDSPLPVRPRPEAREAAPVVRTIVRFSMLSKILIISAVFLIALTALISLFGAAEYARITSEIGTVESDIETYQQQISQVRKTQSSMNDYSSINDVCLDRNMQLIWESDMGMPGTNP